MSGAAASGALLSGAAGWIFLVLAVFAVVSGIAVVVAKNPVHSALFLLVSFLMVACIFILQKAEFVGAVQILVYAGGIMVLFLFVIMLVHQRTIRTAKAFHHQWDVALILLAVGLVVFLYILGTEKFAVVAGRPEALRTQRIGIGHPEGYQEAFAVLYADAAEAIVARKLGQIPDRLALDFPTVADGARNDRLGRGDRARLRQHRTRARDHVGDERIRFVVLGVRVARDRADRRTRQYVVELRAQDEFPRVRELRARFVEEERRRV